MIEKTYLARGFRGWSTSWQGCCSGAMAPLMVAHTSWLSLFLPFITRRFTSCGRVPPTLKISLAPLDRPIQKCSFTHSPRISQLNQIVSEDEQSHLVYDFFFYNFVFCVLRIQFICETSWLTSLIALQSEPSSLLSPFCKWPTLSSINISWLLQYLLWRTK